jgi:ribosome recycling factor
MKIADHKPEFQKAVEHLRHEFSNLRTGRANPAMVDSVTVEAYDSTMPLRNVATVSVPDSHTIQIEPWDKSLLKAVEKGIVAANLGFAPVVDSTAVRIAMPKLTEENRKELVKLMQKKLEEAKVALRGVREKVRNSILEAEKAKEISEDERFRLQEELEKTTKQFVEEIEHLGGEKEKEIMTV